MTNSGKPGKLGEILLATSLITPEQLNQAIAAQAVTGKRLGQLLVEQGAATEDDVAWALSNQLMYPYIFLSHDIIDDEVVRLLPEEFLRERHVLPIHQFGQQVTLAMADPTDQHTVDEVAGQTGLQVNRAVALASNIEEMLRTLSGRRGPGPRRQVGTTEVQYLQFHLAQALQQGVTEIHFDPTTDGQPRVRYRLQGVLVDRAGHPDELHAGVIRQLRDLAGLGQASPSAAATTVRAGEIEARAVVTVLATTAGPAATVALYPYRTGAPDLVPLGVDGLTTQALRRSLEDPHGALLIGCGDLLMRVTLIRAILSGASQGKIWSLETLPVYRDPAINQMVIDASHDAAALMYGACGAGADLLAIDDAARAPALLTAFECARMRHVVIGHPQDDVVGLLGQTLEVAGGALVASTLGAILAARPIRLLCPECKERLRGAGAADGRFAFTPRGCATCSFTGFRGSRLLTEVWQVSPGDRLQLRAGSREAIFAHVSQVVGAALRTQGQGLVEDGLTSPQELSRVVEGA